MNVSKSGKYGLTTSVGVLPRLLNALATLFRTVSSPKPTGRAPEVFARQLAFIAIVTRINLENSLWAQHV